MFNDLINTAAAEMVGKLEGEIVGALNAKVPGWSLLDVQKRCSMMRVHGQPWTYFCLDGQALFEFGEIESEQERRDDGSVVIRYTRKVRRLY